MNTIQSTMFHSARAMPSVLGTSLKSRAASLKASCFFRLRLHILSATAAVIDSSRTNGKPSPPLTPCPIDDDNAIPNALCMAINDAVIVINSTVYTEQTGGDVVSTANKLTFSLNDISIFEASRRKILADSSSDAPFFEFKQPILNFYQLQKSNNTIYSAPHCEISVEFNNQNNSDANNNHNRISTASPQISVSVRMEPVLLSVVYCNVMRWTQTMADFVVNVAADESSSCIHFSLTVPKIDVLVHADKGVSEGVWEELLSALNVQDKGDGVGMAGGGRWQSLCPGTGKGLRRSPFSNQLQHHLYESRAGFRIQVHS